MEDYMYQDYETGNLGQVQRAGVRINDDAHGSGTLITWQELEFALRTLRDATQADGSLPDAQGFNDWSCYAREHLGNTANMIQVVKYHARAQAKKEAVRG